MARTLRLLLAYDGHGFVGWQRQAAGRSVQGVLEEALSRIEGHPVTITGAGRTDAGVHALGQVASLVLDHSIPLGDLTRALNATLPADVRVLEAREAVPAFHARYSARGKVYRYVLFQADVVPPALARYGWHVPYALNLEAMVAASRLLLGRHDFAAFQSAGSRVTNTERTIARSEWEQRPLAEAGPVWTFGAPVSTGSVLVYEVAGDGFLRHMVRAVVGSLVEVGSGRRDPAWLADVMASRNRNLAGPTAPPHGLVLVKVEY